MSVCLTPAGIKYVTMNDSCRSQVFQCMTPTGGARKNGKSHLGTTENCRDSLGVTGLITELLMSTRGR